MSKLREMVLVSNMKMSANLIYLVIYLDQLHQMIRENPPEPPRDQTDVSP